MATLKSIEKWTAIINAARQYPGGVNAYCKANKLALGSYYNWFSRLRSAHPEWAKKASAGRAVSKARAQAGFLPVKVVPDVPRTAASIAVEIRLSSGAVVALPKGMSPQDLAAFVLAMEAKTC